MRTLNACLLLLSSLLMRSGCETWQFDEYWPYVPHVQYSCRMYLWCIFEQATYVGIVQLLSRVKVPCLWCGRHESFKNMRDCRCRLTVCPYLIDDWSSWHFGMWQSILGSWRLWNRHVCAFQPACTSKHVWTLPEVKFVCDIHVETSVCKSFTKIFVTVSDGENGSAEYGQSTDRLTQRRFRWW